MAKGLAMGLNKGHILTKIEVPSNTKEKRPRKRISVIRKVVHEITGHAPYERKAMEILKQSKANGQKLAYKLLKKSLGTHRRALRKREELQTAVAHHEK
jgi:large subunit ribosomal protein L36e